MSKTIKKILSLALVGTMVLGTLVGCSNKGEETASEMKIEVPIEEAFTTLPEQRLLTSSMRDALVNVEERRKEYTTFGQFFFGNGSNVDQEVIDKYNFVMPEDRNDFDAIEKQAPQLFEDITLELTHSIYRSEDKYTLLVENFALLTKNYFSDVWLGENIGEYYLTKEFRDLDPKRIVKQYLSENKITDLEIIEYPIRQKRIDNIPEHYVYTYPLELKGKQDGEEFNKTIYVDMFFTTSEQNRTERDVKLDMTDWEIAQVKIYSDTKISDLLHTTDLDIDKAKEDFGIK